MPYIATDSQIRDKTVKVQLPTWAELQAKACEYARLAEIAPDEDRDRLMRLADMFGRLAQSEAIVYASRAAARRSDRP